MKRIPKQESTAEFKEQAVKRAEEVGSIGRVAEELGLIEQTLRNGVKAAKAGKATESAADSGRCPVVGRFSALRTSIASPVDDGDRGLAYKILKKLMRALHNRAD